MRIRMTQWMCGLLLCSVAGCGGPLAWWNAMVMGPDAVPAEFTFPEADGEPSGKVLVLIVDAKAGQREIPIRQHLMQAINLDMKEKELVASTISNSYFTRFSSSIPFFQQKMATDKGILQVAESLDVEYVLVVKVKEFYLTKNREDSVYEPYFETQCRVLNVHDEEQAWPTKLIWFPVEEIDRGTIAPTSERNFTSNLVKELTRAMSNRITNLFRTSPGRDPSSFPKGGPPMHPEWDLPEAK